MGTVRGRLHRSWAAVAMAVVGLHCGRTERSPDDTENDSSSSGSAQEGSSEDSGRVEQPCEDSATYLCVDNSLFLCVTAGALPSVLLACGASERCNPTSGECDPLEVTSAGGASTSSSGAMPQSECAMATCQGSICHGQPGVAPPPTLGGGLDLFSEGVAERLRDRPASYQGVDQSTTPCPDPPELLIDSANPGESLLVKKLLGTQSCGATEPQGIDISAADQQCIIDWVYEVAEGG